MMITRRHFVTQVAAGASLACWLRSRGPVLGQDRATPRHSGKLTSNHAAATVHPLATQAAMEILHDGGNAIDAAIAAALVLGVVDGHNSGIGGGCLILVRLSDGRIRAIDGRETAGAAARPQSFERHGKPDPELSQTGPLACGVPGEIAAMDRMHRAHGVLAWERLFGAAIRIAREGHPASSSTARTLASEAEAIARFPAARQILLHADGSPLREGDMLIQSDLARTLEKIAHLGSDWFYRGDFAASTCGYINSLGGILTASDFARYQALDRTPIAQPYRDHTVVGFPPPSSGGIHIAQMLGMLGEHDVAGCFQRSRVEGYHLLAECMKRAFSDRAYWLGDSDFVHVPPSLIDEGYLKARMQDFSSTKATQNIERGVPPGTERDPYASSEIPAAPEDRKHTTHLTVADAQGNWVAMTCTINTSWGSKVMVPGTGVILNNQMDDFSLAPATPNAFGLVGSFANGVAPGKRPLSSMSPTLVLDEDRIPVVSCGAAGGPRIINATLQVLVRTLDLGQNIADAIAGARIHHQWLPEPLLVERPRGGNDPFAITDQTILGLESLGHQVRVSENLGIAQGLQRRGDRVVAAHDPRSHGASAS